MSTSHEPRAEFVRRLEERVSAEAERVSAEAKMRTMSAAPRWVPRSPLAAAAALAAVVIVSMGLGGVVVAARYQAEDNQQRQRVVSNIERRVQLAMDKAKAAQQQMNLARQRVETGVESIEVLQEAELAVVVAETEVRVLQLQLAEAQVSGREPQDAVSAPLVSGRDYVLDRMQVQMMVIRPALELEQTRLSRTQQRFTVGAATNLDLVASRNRVKELEMSVQALQQKISIRRQFVAQQIDGPMAELRVLEAEANQRLETLRPKLDLATKQYQDMKARVEVGTAANVDLQEARLRVAQLELDLSKAELDLMVVRKQIDQRKGK